MPYWTLILIVVLAILLILLGCFISRTMKKNKAHRALQERAIMRELQLAKSEGVDIGEDLEMRLARFQQEEDDKEKEMKKGGKVHP